MICFYTYRPRTDNAKLDCRKTWPVYGYFHRCVRVCVWNKRHGTLEQ